MSKESIRGFYAQVAPMWDYWQTRNRFYHAEIRRFVRGMVPPGSAVLELGAGTGEMLAALRPGRGIGLNVAEGLTERARKKFPHLEFYTVDVDQVVDQVAALGDFRADYVVMTNMLDHVYDIWEVLENLRLVLHDRTLLIMTTNNPLWAPALRAGSRLRWRVPDSPRNFITNKDLRSVLTLQGFDVVEEGLILPVPVKIPLLGAGVNTVVREVPILRYSASLQYLAARPRMRRQALSCSVVIPCHNEEANILECIRRVPDMGAWTEILVVDDGSVDATRRTVLKAMQHDGRVRLIAFDRNQGKANAVHAAFQAARGDVLIILDADMTVLPEDLPKFMKPLEGGTADFVNGTRLVYPMPGRAMRWANFLGNKAFCYLASWIMRQRVSDTLCGTKALFRRDYLRLPRIGRERWGDFDLLLGAARLRLRVLEIPVHYQERRAGRSKMRVLRDGWLFLRACNRGWRMLRFPDTVPLAAAPEPVAGWRELEVDREGCLL